MYRIVRSVYVSWAYVK